MLSKIFPKLKTKDKKYELKKFVAGNDWTRITSHYYTVEGEKIKIKSTDAYKKAKQYYINYYKLDVKDETKLDNINLVQHSFKKNYKENKRRGKNSSYRKW